MHSTPVVRSVSDVVTRGIRCLLLRQSSDGFWRDYHLTPGMSEAWSTAWVGWYMANWTPAMTPNVRTSLRKALRAVCASCREGLWGYNRTTGPDADSTAWAIRFLSQAGLPTAATAQRMERFLDMHGRAHTFLESDAGTWGDAHSDVTAMVGLALLAARAPSSSIARVREAVLCTREPGGAWHSFWWSTDTYATYWSVAFLKHSGGLPAEVASEVKQWLQQESDLTRSAFELSHRLLLAMELSRCGDPSVEFLVDGLLELFETNCGWPPSAHLFVPSKTDDAGVAHVGFDDTEGLLTTAVASHALSRWRDTQ